MKRVLSRMALRACALLVVAVVMTGTKLQAAVQPIMLSYTNNMIVAAVSAGALDSTSKLWLVWDSVDRGSDFSAWSVENRIQYAGDIPSADSTYVFDRSRVPAGSVFRVIATKMARSLGEGGYVLLARTSTSTRASRLTRSMDSTSSSCIRQTIGAVPTDIRCSSPTRGTRTSLLGGTLRAASQTESSTSSTGTPLERPTAILT